MPFSASTSTVTHTFGSSSTPAWTGTLRMHNPNGYTYFWDYGRMLEKAIIRQYEQQRTSDASDGCTQTEDIAVRFPA